MKERQEKQYSETIIIDKEQEKTETKVEFSKEQIFGMIKDRWRFTKYSL